MTICVQHLCLLHGDCHVDWCMVCKLNTRTNLSIWTVCIIKDVSVDETIPRCTCSLLNIRIKLHYFMARRTRATQLTLCNCLQHAWTHQGSYISTEKECLLLVIAFALEKNTGALCWIYCILIGFLSVQNKRKPTPVPIPWEADWYGVMLQ